MAAIHWIHEIVEHYYEFSDLLEKVDFVFIPIINPDGNNFSRESVSNFFHFLSLNVNKYNFA